MADNAALGIGVDPGVASTLVALPTIQAGDWSATDLFVKSVGTFKVQGGVSDSLISVSGSNGAATPVGLGTFTGVRQAFLYLNRNAPIETPAEEEPEIQP